MNRTIEYYDNNACGYVGDTRNVDFKGTQDLFLSYVKGTTILDFGCGSGRDSKYFLDRGYVVSATDGSAEMCRMAGEYTGLAVRKLLFNELEDVELYDGVWACSSILHLDKESLKDVLGRIKGALRNGGVLYTSFKYGEFSGVRNGRYFTDFTSDSFKEFMSGVSGFVVVKEWITADVRKDRGSEKWLNVLMVKEKGDHD